MYTKQIPLPIGVRGRLANESLMLATGLVLLLATLAGTTMLFSLSKGEMPLAITMALITIALGLQASIFNNQRQKILVFKNSKKS